MPPGSLTLSIFSAALLMPALWEVSEHEALQQADPPDKLQAVVIPADFGHTKTSPADFMHTVASPANFSCQPCRLQEAKAANVSSSGGELFDVGRGTETQHALSSEKSSNANPVPMWSNAVFAAAAVAVAAAEALVGIGLLLKYLQHRRASSLHTSEEKIPALSAPEDGGISLSSSDSDNHTLCTSVKRLTAENNALKGAVHAVWRGQAIDIWDFEDQVGAASDDSAKSSRHSRLSVSSTFDDGHSSSRTSSSVPEAFSIGSRESSFATSRETSDAASSHGCVSSDDDAASSHNPVSSDDDAASSHNPASSDDDAASSHNLALRDDDAASSHNPGDDEAASHPTFSDDEAPSAPRPTSSGDDAELMESDVQRARSICFSKPLGLASTFAELPRFGAPYTPSDTSSDESEGRNRKDRQCMDCEQILSQAQIQLTGSYTKKHCFSSPYASSASGSSQPCDEEYQQDSEDDQKSLRSQQHRKTRIAPIQESMEIEEEEDFVRDSFRLVDGALMDRRNPTEREPAKQENGSRDLVSMMLSIW